MRFFSFFKRNKMVRATDSTVLELFCDPLPCVRIGMVGLGRRGVSTLRRYAVVSGALFTALADLRAESLKVALETISPEQRASDLATYEGPDAWRHLCRNRNVDVVYICTDWASHAEIAIEAMEQGKHVAVEVPAAMTVEQCEALVRTAERTRRHCFMAENCCYDPFALAQKEMIEKGVLGRLTHLEGGYLHDLRQNFAEASRGAGSFSWMENDWIRHAGNPYPTHGIGPLGLALGLHRGDRMVRLVSMTSKTDEDSGGKTNSSLIYTEQGRTLLLQINLNTPQPYNRLQRVVGSRGYASKYPIPVVQTADMPEALTGDAAVEYMKLYLNSPAALKVAEGQRKGVHNAMNYAMDARFVYCLQHGLPLDMDVYDAAEWSCLTELTAKSAAQGGVPVDIPDFTHGHWHELQGHRFYE